MPTVKTHELQPDGSMLVKYADDDRLTSWSIMPEQLEAHAPMFRAEMKTADRNAYDARVNLRRGM